MLVKNGLLHERGLPVTMNRYNNGENTMFVSGDKENLFIQSKSNPGMAKFTDKHEASCELPKPIVLPSELFCSSLFFSVPRDS